MQKFYAGKNRMHQCQVGKSSAMLDVGVQCWIKQMHFGYSSGILDTALPCQMQWCYVGYSSAKLENAVHFKYSCANLNTTVKYWIQHCDVGYSRVPNNCHFENISNMVDTKQRWLSQRLIWMDKVIPLRPTRSWPELVTPLEMVFNGFTYIPELPGSCDQLILGSVWAPQAAQQRTILRTLLTLNVYYGRYLRKRIGDSCNEAD